LGGLHGVGQLVEQRPGQQVRGDAGRVSVEGVNPRARRRCIDSASVGEVAEVVGFEHDAAVGDEDAPVLRRAGEPVRVAVRVDSDAGRPTRDGTFLSLVGIVVVGTALPALL